MHIPQVIGGVYLHMRTCARACAIRDQLFGVVRDQLAMRFAPLRGGVPLHPKRGAHVCTPFPYLGNDWTDCAEIWYVVTDELARQYTQTKDGVHLHVRTCGCAPFSVSQKRLDGLR